MMPRCNPAVVSTWTVPVSANSCRNAAGRLPRSPHSTPSSTVAGNAGRRNSIAPAKRLRAWPDHAHVAGAVHGQDKRDPLVRELIAFGGLAVVAGTCRQINASAYACLLSRERSRDTGGEFEDGDPAGQRRVCRRFASVEDRRTGGPAIGRRPRALEELDPHDDMPSVERAEAGTFANRLRKTSRGHAKGEAYKRS